MEIAYRLTRPVALDVRLHVEGLTVLLGASGAGKTSLLRAIAGLLPADGTPFGGLPVERRPIGYLPQHYALFPHLDALGNVAFPLGDLSRRERHETAMTLLEALGVAHCASRRPRSLSGGEQQRVALARALARQPKLLLLDEPLSAVDAPARREIVAWLAALVQRLGIPTLAVTHDPMLARAADRVAVLANGRIVQQGEREAVFAAPTSVESARLLDFGTLLPIERAGTSRVQTPIGCLTIPDGGDNGVPGPAWCAIRASGAWITAPGAPSPVAAPLALRVPGQLVRGSETTAAEVLVNGVTVRALLATELLANEARTGDAVELVIPARAVRVLR